MLSWRKHYIIAFKMFEIGEGKIVQPVPNSSCKIVSLSAKDFKISSLSGSSTTYQHLWRFQILKLNPEKLSSMPQRQVWKPKTQ